MKHPPKVTIGLCVKNCAKTIRRCIESIVSQDYPHKFIEIIIVDGYSEDSTLSIIEEVLSKIDIKSKIFFENEGLGKARQIIIDSSDGSYIIWIDSDMIIPQSFIRKHVDFMENMPSVGIAQASVRYYHQNNIVSKLEALFRTMSMVKWGRIAVSKSTSTAGSIYRVEAVKEVGGFDVRMKSGEDRELSYRIGKAGWLIDYNMQNIFYEEIRYSLRSLWKKYSWYGYGWRSLINKTGLSRILIQRFPLIALIEGLILSKSAYKLTGKIFVFMLPLHLIFIRTAWYFGLIKAYLKNELE